MPKQKTHRGTAKRLRRTARGKMRRGHAKLRHLLTWKPRKRKRHLSGTTLVSDADQTQTKRLLPYWRKM